MVEFQQSHRQPVFIEPASTSLNLRGPSSLSDHQRSSIAVRVASANTSIEDKSLWSVAIVIIISLIAVHGSSYVISEYAIFGEYWHYLEKMPKLWSDNKFGMTDSVPTAKLNDEQFQLYMSFIMYGTVMLTGLGAEYLVWRMSLTSDWDEGIENKWRMAQFLFPILVATSVGLAIQGNFLCLPMLAVSIFKLGFPETILFFYSALHEKDHCFTERIVNMIRGIGTVIHHSSSTLFVTMLLLRVTQPTPAALSVLPPLIMQHWFVLLKYNYHWIYVAIAVILEVWFEWTTFSILEKVYQQHWVWGIIVLPMLFAHWCYFGAGGVSLLFLDKDTGGESSLHHTPAELESLDMEEEGCNEIGEARANDHWMKRYRAPFVCLLVVATTTAGVSILVKNTTEATGNHLCPEYCDLYANAVQVCPYYVSYYVPEAAKQSESRDTCIIECEGAYFSKTDSDVSFTSDSLQCRMNHARMAIKEGSLANSMHCVHATLDGPQRCTQDRESIAIQKQLAIGKTIFYDPSDWLSADNPLSISEFQALLASITFLIGLRGRLYVAYPSKSQEAPELDCTSTDLRYRSEDGSCNSIDQPFMGAVGASFTRNLVRSEPHKQGDIDISRVANILKRDEGVYGDIVAPFNQLASCWIQFMTHDWFQHDADEPQGSNMKNKVTHWWDASQLYGSTKEEIDSVRAEGGKLHLDENDEIDYSESEIPITGFSENWWAGLHIMHTVFAREHNDLVDALAKEYPSMTSDELFGTARNTIAAILAKIHTIEWTPTLLDNRVSTFGLNTNWYGLESVVADFFGQKYIPDEVEEIVKEMKVPSVMNGKYPTELTMYSTPFYMTEEFVSVYRMHSLLPDEMKVDGGRTLSLQEMVFSDARNLVSNSENTTQTFLRSFALTPARTLSLKNYPRSLYDIDIGSGETINLAEIDITRDRERGIPRYNDARRQLLLTPYKSINDLTDNEEELDLLKSVYSDVEQVDFMVGCLVDRDRPEGFAFGIVPYYIFVVMASRRLLSDRFFQEGLNEENYSNIGLKYIKDTRFQDILKRQFPDMRNAVPANPFSNKWTF